MMMGIILISIHWKSLLIINIKSNKPIKLLKQKNKTYSNAGSLFNKSYQIHSKNKRILNLKIIWKFTILRPEMSGTQWKQINLISCQNKKKNYLYLCSLYAKTQACCHQESIWDWILYKSNQRTQKDFLAVFNQKIYWEAVKRMKRHRVDFWHVWKQFWDLMFTLMHS